MISHEEAMKQNACMIFPNPHPLVEDWIKNINSAKDLWLERREALKDQSLQGEVRAVAEAVESLCWYRYREASALFTPEMLYVGEYCKNGDDPDLCELFERFRFDQSLPVPDNSDVYGLPPLLSVRRPDVEERVQDACNVFISPQVFQAHNDKLIEFIHKMVLVTATRNGIQSSGYGLSNLIDSMVEFKTRAPNSKPCYDFFVENMPSIIMGCYYTDVRNCAWDVSFRTKIFINVEAEKIPPELRGVYVGFSLNEPLVWMR